MEDSKFMEQETRLWVMVIIANDSSVLITSFLVAFREIAKSVYFSFVMPVRMQQLGFYWTGFREIWYLEIFRKPVRKFQVSWKSDNNNWYFTWISIYIFDHISLSSSYLLTPWCRVLLEQPSGLQLVKKFPAFHRTRRFITALTSVRHLSLSWASPIHVIYTHPTSWRSVLIFSTHLRLVVSFPPVSPPKPYTSPFLTHARHMPSPSHSSRFYHPHNIGWAVHVS